MKKLLIIELKKIYKGNFLSIVLGLIVLCIITNTIFYISAYEMSDNQGNNYITETKAWFMMMDPATGKNGSITPYQKDVYMKYKETITNKIKYIRSQDDDIVIEMNKKSIVMENAMKIYTLTFLLMVIVLVIHLFGRELSNGEIYYTYSFPYLRTQIFSSKILLMNVVLFILITIWYFVFIIFNDVMFGVKGMSYFGYGFEMHCNLFYLIKFLLLYFKCIGAAMALICINLYVKKNILTLVIGLVGWLLSDILENFAIVMNWSNYSLLPTFSFDLENKIIKIPYVNEIEYFYNNVTQVIDDSYSLIFLVSYDVILLIILYMIARDKYKYMEII